ncbi:hypothetical protein BC332_34535 [Capsicum chinense]|nr:hypothetical protein BC332_34535 [Capsicum chinense]
MPGILCGNLLVASLSLVTKFSLYQTNESKFQCKSSVNVVEIFSLQTGDRILEVDGVDLRHASHERAVEVIRASSRTVTFLVQSLVQWSGENDERHSRSSQNTGTTRRKAPQPPTPTEPQAPFASTTNNFRSPSSEQLQESPGHFQMNISLIFHLTSCKDQENFEQIFHRAFVSCPHTADA